MSKPRVVQVSTHTWMEPYCERGSEENCIGNFALRYAFEQQAEDLHVTYVKVMLDGTVQTVINGYRHIWPPDPIWYQVALEYDQTGVIEDRLIAELDIAKAHVSPVTSKPRSTPRPQRYVLNKSQRTFRRLGGGQKPPRKGQVVFEGTLPELREKHPGFIDARNVPKPSARRQRYAEMVRDHPVQDQPAPTHVMSEQPTQRRAPRARFKASNA